MQSNSLSKPSQPEKQITATTTAKPPPTASSDRKPPSTAGFRPPEQTPKCPRCDSPNTKFCYYNNYSLAQPRHFCKTCRRYWTKGGALRNVPIGGGCRKNKRTKSSHRNSDDPKLLAQPESIAGKYFPGLDFGIPFSRLQSPQTGLFNHLISLGDLSSCSTTPSSTAPFAIDPSPPVSLLGFNYFVRNGESSNGYQCLGSQSSHSSLASSIESLSTINADLHWKLQQQRLGLLFTGENQKETGVSVGDSVSAHLQEQQQQPILFQSLEACKNDGSDSKSRKNSVLDNGLIRESSTTEWLFQNSYSSTNNTNTTTTNNSNTWNGLQAWTDLQQYSAMN